MFFVMDLCKIASFCFCLLFEFIIVTLFYLFEEEKMIGVIYHFIVVVCAMKKSVIGVESF